MRSPVALFGAFLRGSFGLPKPDRQAVERVKELARSALQASPETAFAVNEIETVILVMELGRKTRALKVTKPLDEVTEQDILAALDG
jgi:hypothetical protein